MWTFVHLAGMLKVIKVNKFNSYYILINVYSKYAWVILLKDKKGVTINRFGKVLDESGHKLTKRRADKGSKFYIRSNESRKSI